MHVLRRDQKLTKFCSKCEKKHPVSRFSETSRNRDGRLSWCKDCIGRYNKKWRKTLGKNYHADHREVLNKQSRVHRRKNPENRLWIGAKTRAKQKGFPFDLKISDISIPEICPALGIPLQLSGSEFPARATDNSPSLDRFDPKLGYVSGNVYVLSHLANTIKNKATADQVLAVGNWMKRIQEKK